MASPRPSIVLLAAMPFVLVHSILRADSIHDAASTGDLVALERLLKQNPSLVNARTSAGATPLLWAAIRGQAEAAKVLIEAGADPNLAQGDGWAPLHAAVADGSDAAHLEIARLWLDKGAKVDVCRADGWTPLLAAALKGNIEGMKLLLERGSSLTATDVKGSLPLHFAAYVGQPAAIRFLLGKGADPKAKNNDGSTALDLALGGTKVEVVDALLSHTLVTLRFDGTPLQDALQQLCEKAKLKFKLASPATGTVTLNLVDVPFLSTLRTVLRTQGANPPLTLSISEGALLISSAPATEKPHTPRQMNADRRYRFNRTISKEVLNNYLSRAVTHFGLCSTSPEPASAYFEDDMRMLTEMGAKIVGRAA